MSTQIQKTQHCFALACLNLFHIGQRTAGTGTTKPAKITLADLTAMPEQTQLLLAHALEQNNPDLTLLNDDTDANQLVSVGWLASVPCPTIGIVSFKIKRHIWHQLRALESRFLNTYLLAELKNYRQNKSALYPWIWQGSSRYR